MAVGVIELDIVAAQGEGFFYQGERRGIVALLDEEIGMVVVAGRAARLGDLGGLQVGHHEVIPALLAVNVGPVVAGGGGTGQEADRFREVRLSICETAGAGIDQATVVQRVAPQAVRRGARDDSGAGVLVHLRIVAVPDSAAECEFGLESFIGGRRDASGQPGRKRQRKCQFLHAVPRFAPDSPSRFGGADDAVVYQPAVSKPVKSYRTISLKPGTDLGTQVACSAATSRRRSLSLR